MANPKYKLTVNQEEKVTNSYFEMSTITVEEVNENEPKENSSAPVVANPLGTSENPEEARKKELERIKKWIEDRRKAMEANKEGESGSQGIRDSGVQENKELGRKEEKIATVSGKKEEDVKNEEMAAKKREIDEQRRLVEERRKKMEEMIARMREAAAKEQEEERNDAPGLDQAHILRKKMQEKIDVINHDKTKEELKEEVRKRLEEYEKTEENVETTIKEDMQEVVREVASKKSKIEEQNKLIHDLNELRTPTKKDVHSIFNQLNKIKK